MGKKRGLSVAVRSKIVTLHEEGYSERQISNRVKFSKTAVHQAIVKFRNLGVFKICTDPEDPGLPPKGMTTEWQYVLLQIQARKFGRHCCSKVQLPVHHCKTSFSR